VKHAIATFVVSPQPFGKSAFQKELTYAISNKWHSEFKPAHHQDDTGVQISGNTVRLTRPSQGWL
jgi:hypothetical protein